MTVHKTTNGSIVAHFKEGEIFDICGKTQSLSPDDEKSLAELALDSVGEKKLSLFSYRLFLYNGDALLFAEKTESELVLRLNLPF